MIIIASMLVVCFSVYAESKGTLFRDDFSSLDYWEPLYFKRINEHTDYSIWKEEGESYLKSESNASASAMVYKEDFNVYDYPKIQWRWKISNVYKKGDAGTKEGDDYPVRIYVFFKYDPDKASFGKKIKYGLAKKMYGKYPPDSTLNYIWANKAHDENILTSAYADESRMIILQSGPDRAGTWVTQEINLLDDYYMAFGKKPPDMASIAIMNDSDDTGESSVSFIDYIEVYK